MTPSTLSHSSNPQSGARRRAPARARHLLAALLWPWLAWAAPTDGEAPAPLNINTATVEQLASQLDRIGKARAQAIADWREEYGQFSGVDDLTAVPGISQTIVDLNRERMVAE